MNRNILGVVVVFASLTAYGNPIVQTERQRLEYTIERLDTGSLRIQLTFKGNSEGSMILNLPNEWAGQRDIFETISGLSALSRRTSIKAMRNRDQYLIEFPKNSVVSIQYRLSQDWRGALKYPLYFRPVIKPNYFYFEGYSGLVYPGTDLTADLECSVKFVGFREHEFTGCSFFTGAAGEGMILKMDNLLNSFFCGGDFRKQEIEVREGKKVTVAIRGIFSFPDDDAFKTISKIILQERIFWDDPGVDNFFVAILPMDDRGNSGGTAHFNSFVLFQSRNLGLGQGLTYLISHEYFHNWLGQGLKMPQPEEIYKWFSEGFTDYYAYKFLFTSDITTRDQFYESINRMMREYFLSPHVVSDNKDLVGRYWESRGLKDLSYRRGLTIAFMIDNMNKDKSLDDFMRSLYKQSRPSMMFSKELFDKAFKQFAGQEWLDVIDQTNAGHNDGLKKKILEGTVHKTVMSPIQTIFDLGFDLDQSIKAKKIIGLKAESNASKAGLVEGMEITNNFSIYNNNTEKPARVQVLRGSAKEWIEFIPARTVSIEIPQIVVTD